MRHLTGEVSTTRGIYRSNCKCRSEITIRRDLTFPYCPKCHKSVTWLFVRSVFVEDGPPLSNPDDGPKGSMAP